MNDIVKMYELDAELPKVYEAWISNETVVAPAIAVEVSAKVGGNYCLVCKLGDDEWKMEGKFLEVIPYQKLNYTWEWNRDGKVSTVNVSFARADGKTAIELIHSGLADEESVMLHASGWDSYIKGFRKYVEASG